MKDVRASTCSPSAVNALSRYRGTSLVGRRKLFVGSTMASVGMKNSGPPSVPSSLGDGGGEDGIALSVLQKIISIAI